MAYYNLWVAGMILLIVIAIILSSIITCTIDYLTNNTSISLFIIVWIIFFALFGTVPFINLNASDVVLVSEKTHDVDKIIAENNLKVHASTFHQMCPVQEKLDFNTDITYIEPGVKYVVYWTTGFGKKKMRAFEYIKKESADERQTKINQAEIDKYKLGPSVSGNNP